MWRVMDGNIELFEVNEDDDPPHRFLKDVEGTTILWEEANLQLSWLFLLFSDTHIGWGDDEEMKRWVGLVGKCIPTP